MFTYYHVKSHDHTVFQFAFRGLRTRLRSPYCKFTSRSLILPMKSHPSVHIHRTAGGNEFYILRSVKALQCCSSLTENTFISKVREISLKKVATIYINLNSNTTSRRISSFQKYLNLIVYHQKKSVEYYYYYYYY
jgi:hypothetical protein